MRGWGRGGAWLGLTLLIGCQEVRTTVTPKSRDPQVFRGMSFTVGMVDGARAATPWARAQADLISASLEAHGMTRVQDGAEALVLFDCAIDGGQTINQGRWVREPGITQSVPSMPRQVANPIFPWPARAGDPAGGKLPMPAPIAPPPFGAKPRFEVLTPPVLTYVPHQVKAFTASFTLAIYRPAAVHGEKLYELRSVTWGPADNLAVLANAVFEAVLKDFPHEHGQPKVFRIPSH